MESLNSKEQIPKLRARWKEQCRRWATFQEQQRAQELWWIAEFGLNHWFSMANSCEEMGRAGWRQKGECGSSWRWSLKGSSQGLSHQHCRSCRRKVTLDRAVWKCIIFIYLFFHSFGGTYGLWRSLSVIFFFYKIPLKLLKTYFHKNLSDLSETQVPLPPT